MYIKELRARGFRCFADTTVEFQPGLNVVIGENNAGKTALLRALGLVFQREGRRSITRHDFHHSPSVDTSLPPSIEVRVTLASSDADTEADKALVATWLTRLEDSWEAELTYRFALPDPYHEEFCQRRDRGAGDPNERYWRAVEWLLPKFVGRTYAGSDVAEIRAEPDALSKFDFQFLDAIRDAESQMLTGRSPLLRRMLGLVLDNSEEHQDPESRGRNEREFKQQADQLLTHLQARVDTESLFRLIDDTGAGAGGRLSLSGALAEGDILTALGLLVSGTNASLPVSHNGLGYNNLIYVSLVLASLRFTSRRYEGDNEKLFPMLVVEEPEAHLHPALQYRLLKFVREQLEQSEDRVEGSRQVFMTTHSTHVTAAAGLDALVCLVAEEDGTVRPAYPGRVFATGDEQRSKRYVERYLDATKSNMLFSKGVLLVEGIAEQHLAPCFADYLGRPFENNFAAVIAVDGLCFKHFLPLFGASKDPVCRAAALPRRVACAIDGDPARQAIGESQWKACWPYDDDPDYEYRWVSPVVESLQAQVDGVDNARVFHGVKTLEYDMARENPNLPLIVTPSCTYADKLRAIAIGDVDDDLVLSSRAGESAHEALTRLSDTDTEDASRSRFATYYLQSAANAKGEHAFELERQLRDNLELSEQERESFTVPSHIAEAIEWACPETAA